MWCNQAFFYQDKNFIEAYGDVVLIQGDTINLKSNYLEYNGNSKIAYAKGNVVLKEPSSTLYTESLYFVSFALLVNIAKKQSTRS